MRRIILASHGGLAKGMADSVQMILGEVKELSYISLYPGEQPQDILKRAEAVIEESGGEDVIIVSDVLGGSVNNVLMNLLKRSGVYIITGMHLGLIISLCSSDETDTEALARRSVEESPKYIIYANDLMKEML